MIRINDRYNIQLTLLDYTVQLMLVNCMKIELMAIWTDAGFIGDSCVTMWGRQL